MEVRVLGPLEVWHDDVRLDLGGPKQRTVLTLLVANAGRQVTVDSLIEGTYGEDAPDRAHRSIHTFVSNLRGSIGEMIERRGDGYLFTGPLDSIDAHRFKDEVSAAIDDDDPGSTRDRLRDALDLWRGHPYAGIDAHTLLEADITRLTELRVTAIETRIEADLELGRDRELVAELDTLTAEYPLNERLRSHQMLALYRAGRQAEALRAYERTRLDLMDMGLEPSVELRELEQRMLDQDPSLAVDQRPTVRQATVLVADVADQAAVENLAPDVRHRLISAQSAALDHAVAGNGGRVFSQRGSTLYAVFSEADEAATAAILAQTSTSQWQPRLRIAIATGEIEEIGTDEISGPPISRAAALLAAGHGGQVLLSSGAQTALTSTGRAGFGIRSLGSQDLPGMVGNEFVYQLDIDGELGEFPALRLGDAPPPMPVFGDRVLGYELRALIGAGPHGEVHRAYQASIGREVAVKTIRPSFANDVAFIRRFEVEAQLVARLEHPQIVPLYDYWREPDGAFLVMRWMRGGNLAERLETGLQPSETVRDLVVSVGTALVHAHQRGVAHGAIKPSNVLFDDDNNIYLTDFGIGSTVDGWSDAVARDTRQFAQLIDRCAADKSQIDDVLRSATSEPGFSSVEELVTALTDALGAPVSAVTQLTPSRNPYKGLAAFGEHDAADFYGRDAASDQLIDVLREKRLVGVVGPSGIGKSSVVRAGLIGAIRQGAIEGSDQWLITDMMPGRYPVEELASALLRVATTSTPNLEDELRRDPRGLVRAIKRHLPEGSTVLLVLDQFEEIFTLVESDEVRSDFLALLTAAIEDERCDIRVVLTMRADFFDRPLRHGSFGELLRSATVPISGPTEDEMRQIIERPALDQGVEFEPGLVDRIIADVGDQPGALPLVEFALTELFGHRTSDRLSIDRYTESGGVLAALGRRAQTIYDDLEPAEQDAARSLFQRLVQVDESGRDTRRRARRTELDRLDIDRTTLDRILNAFGAHRLLTFDRDPITRGPTVEVAHEALLSRWPELQRWIDDQREDLLIQRRLSVALADWEEAGRSDTYLLSGGRLSHYLEWSRSTALTLTSTEHDFLETSLRADDTRSASKRRRRRAVMAGFGIAAVVASVLAVAATNARRQATEQADLARAESLAANAVVALDADPQLALLLATEAIDTAPSIPAVSSLHLGIQRHRAEMLIPPPDESFGAHGILHPEGERIAVVGVGTARVQMWEVGATEPSWDVTLTNDDGAGFASYMHFWFSADGATLYVPLGWVDHDGSTPGIGLYVVDAVTGDTDDFMSIRCLQRVTPAGTQYVDAVSPQVLFAFDRSLPLPDGTCWPEEGGHGGVIDIGSGAVEILFETEYGPGRPPTLSNDGRYLALAGFFEQGDRWPIGARVFDTAGSGAPPVFDSGLFADGSVESLQAATAVLSQDGKRLLTGQNPTYLKDTLTGATLQTYQGNCGRVFFTPDEDRIVATCQGSTILFDTDSGAEIMTLVGHKGQLWNSTVDSAGTRLVTSARDGVILWDVAAEARGDLDPITLGATAENRFFPQALARSDEYVLARRGVLHVFILNDQAPHQVDIVRLEDGVTIDSRDVWAAAISKHGVLFEQPIVATNVTTPAGATDAVHIGAPRLIDIATGAELITLDGCDWYWLGPFEWPEAGTGCTDVIPQYWTAQFADDGTKVLAYNDPYGEEILYQPGSLWDTGSGDVTIVPSAIAVSDDGQLIVNVPTGEGPITIVDIATGVEVAQIETQSRVTRLRFDGDSGLLLGSMADLDLLVIDPETWEATVLENAGARFIIGSDASPDGQWVATTQSTGVVVVWDLSRERVEAEIPVEGAIGAGLRGITFLDNETVLVAPEEGTDLLRFSIDTDVLRESALSSLTRGFLPEECATYNIDPCPALEDMKARQ